MKIRAEEEQDLQVIQAVTMAAFKTKVEANLIDLLREQAKPVISLVAEEEEGKVIGHIMFSPVTLTGHPELKIMGLAPMAVSPNHQGKGVGKQLVTVGLKECVSLGYGAAVVLGHPQYYPRFGFVPSTRFSIKCEYEVPEDVFMIQELKEGYLQGASGTIKYHDAFNQV